MKGNTMSEQVTAEETEKALRKLELASATLRKTIGGKAGDGAENNYSQAYNECVRLGIKPALRKKYR